MKQDNIQRGMNIAVFITMALIVIYDLVTDGVVATLLWLLSVVAVVVGIVLLGGFIGWLLDRRARR